MDADDNGIYRLDSATVLLATVGIVFSHLALVIYKISPWGNLNPDQYLLQIYREGVRTFLGRRL